ncbi:hypothetical protein FPOA_11916 [Fusarium poae]|uniref:Uncharacterized protein n=1 Tax=Fusarium poae TaxID=36050 RepID=A0A1B8AIT9_FUSPO|nr:hypothetical protein FPOA_11916 [Fusarium poae]
MRISKTMSNSAKRASGSLVVKNYHQDIIVSMERALPTHKCGLCGHLDRCLAAGQPSTEPNWRQSRHPYYEKDITQQESDLRYGCRRRDLSLLRGALAWPRGLQAGDGQHIAPLRKPRHLVREHVYAM